jgi:Arc/MetJ-type ribon-helix-helix transcriptional regulator
MRAKTVGFAIADEDRELLDQLVDEFGGGNRSEFLRVAMRRMRHEMLAQRFREIQKEAHELEGGRVLTEDEVLALVKQVSQQA